MASYGNYLTGISSSTRISGMVSGMDTDSLVNSLLQIEQLKIDKVYKSKTLVEWKNDSLREVNNMIRVFRNKYMSVLSPETNMYTSSAYKSYDVEMESNANVKITANSGAITGNYVINEITRLAKGATATGADKISGGQGLNTSVALKDLPLARSLEFVNGKISFSINDVVFEFDENDTLQKLINDINGSEANVTVYYSSLSDKLTLSTKATGSSATLQVENILGNAVGDDSALGIDEGIFVGEDAEITINNYKVIRSSNTFVIDGIEYNLRGTTDKPISFSVSQNIDTTVNKIKDFINAYNELVENLNNRIYEEKNYNYTPLTEAQKKEMKEEDIAKWEEQAKKGLLRNDIGISTLLNELRASVYQKIEGLNLSLADIGITTGAYNDRGKLVIDEQKLRNALKENGDNVMKLFTQNSSSEDKSVKYKESGFIPRLLSSFTDYNGKVDFDALSQKINEYKDHIKELEYKMYLKGEKYYKKFAAMESALAKMNSQSMWLAQQLGMY
ncbi:MAG: flagellar filament capping protein FliD [Clostridia bacterium]|jgi:flagellar hook-associated protein 2